MYLITPSLLNSFAYYMAYDGEDEISSRADFLRTLSREKSAPTEAMQRGIDFENRVFAYCNGTPDDNETVKAIGDIVKGGMWQQAVKMTYGEYLLYARADVIKRDTIYDIKCSKVYDLGKYYNSAQHKIELFVTGMPKFSYLISDERNWFREDYFNHDGLELEIRHMLREFTGYLGHDSHASQLFHERWLSLDSQPAPKPLQIEAEMQY